MSTLKDLTDDEMVWEFLIKIENLTEILKALHSFQNAESILSIVRLLSKIVDEDDGSIAVTQCPDDHILDLLAELEAQRYHIDVTVQIAFIIGKLVSVCEETALEFVTSPNFISTVVVFGEYVSEHIQFKDTVSDCFKSERIVAAGDRNWRQEIFDVILKIVCIWASICLHTRAGKYLALHLDILTHLLAVVAAYAEKDVVVDTGLALHSFLVVIGNISYYLESDSEMCTRTAERVIPFLDDCFSFEVRLEASCVVRNLTRSSGVRTYIQEHALLPAFIKLLNENDKAFNIAAYGIIMNLLMDKNSRQTFYREHGVTRVLHKLHLCSNRDWRTSALLCQILWNYFGGEAADEIYLSSIEAQHLKKYLSYSIGDTKGMPQPEKINSYDEWEKEFCPVAKKLLEHLHTKEIVQF